MRKPTTLDRLEDRLNNLHIEQNYVSADFLELSNIVAGLIDEVKRIDAQASRAANTASCLANGIQPD